MKTQRSSSAPLYPIFLDIRALRVLVVGGGAVATRKVADLIESGAHVTVVSPQIDPAIVALSERLAGDASMKSGGAGLLCLVERKYEPTDLVGKRLIFAATDNVELNRSICDAAHASGVFANCAAPPEAGTFALPATVRRGGFCLAVSTGGASASLSAHWRQRLEKIAGEEWGLLVELLEKKRLEVKAKIADPVVRRELLSRLGKPHWAAKLKKIGAVEVERRMDDLIAKASKGT